MKENTEEMLQRIAEIESLCREQEKLLNNLIEYLERTDDKFKIDPGNFFSWGDQLETLRREELVQKDIQKAKHFLQGHNYIVAADANDIDAQKLRQWLTSKNND